MPKGHHLEAARGHPGQQHRHFVGFRAAVGEVAFLELARGNLGQFLGQRDNGFIGVERGGVLELVHLGLDLPRDLLVAVAHADGEDAAEKIEILPTFDIEDVLATGVVDHQRLGVIVDHAGEEITFVLFADFVRGRGCSSRHMVSPSAVEPAVVIRLTAKPIPVSLAGFALPF